VSIIITNISGDNRGNARYALYINEQEICTFEHYRPDGLSECLLRASKAVERQREKESRELVKKLQAMKDGRE
jgi:hypothetical protein